MAVKQSGRAYERYGWVILLVSATLGLLFAVVLTLAPNLIFSGPGFRVGNAPLLIRLWGITSNRLIKGATYSCRNVAGNLKT
jgi:hypothetical protein